MGDRSRATGGSFRPSDYRPRTRQRRQVSSDIWRPVRSRVSARNWPRRSLNCTRNAVWRSSTNIPSNFCTFAALVRNG